MIYENDNIQAFLNSFILYFITRPSLVGKINTNVILLSTAIVGFSTLIKIIAYFGGTPTV